jgi:hypothetical protein
LKQKNVVERQQTAPGSWTIVPDSESSASKRPAHKLTSLLANLPSPALYEEAIRRYEGTLIHQMNRETPNGKSSLCEREKTKVGL